MFNTVVADVATVAIHLQGVRRRLRPTAQASAGLRSSQCGRQRDDQQYDGEEEMPQHATTSRGASSHSLMVNEGAAGCCSWSWRERRDGRAHQATQDDGWYLGGCKASSLADYASHDAPRPLLRPAGRVHSTLGSKARRVDLGATNVPGDIGKGLEGHGDEGGPPFVCLPDGREAGARGGGISHGLQDEPVAAHDFFDGLQRLRFWLE